MIVLQNAGIESTSVSHAALIVGAVPALVALIAAITGQRARPVRPPGSASRSRSRAWGSWPAAAAAAPRSAATRSCCCRSTLSATFVVIQPSLLRGRDPIAVTAVQMVAGGLAAVPNAALEGMPPAPASAAPVVALVALAIAGTLLPFALFAYGQSRVAPELAGAFLNLEPLVGTAAGALAFGDPFGPLQLAGGAVILLGIALSTTPRGAAPRTPKVALRTTRRLAAPSDERGHGGRLRPCSTPVSTRSTSPPPPRPTASARAAEP